MKKFNLQEWLEFHKFASNLYAYPYDEQLQIYNINRNATAVAPFEVWSNMGLRINGGTRSMTIYDKNGTKKHLFDISQTNGKDIKPWKYNVSYNEYIFDMLDKMYEKNGSETRADRVEKTFHNNIYDYVFESVYSHPKSPTGQLSTELCELIAETVTYTVCERLNVIEEQYKYDFSNFPVIDENAQELVGTVAAVYVNAFCRTAKQFVKTVSLEEAQGRQAMRQPIVSDDISDFEQKVTVEETTVTDSADIETENDISEKEDDRYVVEPDDTVEPEPDYNEFVDVPEKSERLALTAEQQETVLKQIFQADYKKVNKQNVVTFYSNNNKARALIRYTYAVYKGSHAIKIDDLPDVAKWSATQKGIVLSDSNGAEIDSIDWHPSCYVLRELINSDSYIVERTSEIEKTPEAEKETEKYRGNIISASTMKQQRLYSKFVKLFPDFLTDYKYLKFESDLGFMTLSLDKIGSNSVAMAHYYEQNGDLMVDPEIVFDIDSKNKTLTAVSYQQDGMGIYKTYEQDSDEQDNCNSFVDTWFNNILTQAYRPVRAINLHGKEITFANVLSMDKNESEDNTIVISENGVSREYIIEQKRDNIVNVVDKESGEYAVEVDLENRVAVKFISSFSDNQKNQFIEYFKDYDAVYNKESFIQSTAKALLLGAETDDYVIIKHIEMIDNDPDNVKEVNDISSEKSFAEQVDEALGGVLPFYTSLKVCDTPQILLDVGCEQLPMLYTQKHLKNAILPPDEKNHRHGLEIEQIKRLPELLSYPVMIIDSPNRKDSIIVVTSEVDKSDNPIIASIKPNGKGRYEVENVSSNFITSVYGRNNFSEYFRRIVQSDNLLFCDKQKSQAMFERWGEQYSELTNNLDFNIIIHQSRNIVKGMQKENNAEQLSFFENSTLEDTEVEIPFAVGDEIDYGERHYTISKIDKEKNTVTLLDYNTGWYPISHDEDLSVVIAEFEAVREKEIVESEALATKPNNFVKIDESSVDNGSLSENFVITDEQLGVGGPKQKFNRNVTAIQLLKKIEEENRNITKDEQQVLSEYVGWGGIPEAFEKNNSSWSQEYEQLKNLLTEEEYQNALGSVLNAHYTQPVVINAMYTALSELGFSGGKILEPAAGVGNFIGCAPENIADRSFFTAVEIDSISGRIAKQLYPESEVQVCGYENAKLRAGTFDVAVGNVPFGDYSVVDKKYNRDHAMIHDYFFLKTLEMVRPNGVIAFITSKGTMDKQSSKIRKQIDEKAEFIGAIRLPNTAFKANAGTTVVSDIIFLKKRSFPQTKLSEWVDTAYNKDGQRINQYFINHPEMICGELKIKSGPYGPEMTVDPFSDKSLKDALSECVENLVNNTDVRYTQLSLRPVSAEVDDTQKQEETLPAPENIPDGFYVSINDNIYKRNGSVLVEAKRKSGKAFTEREKGMLTLAIDLARDLRYAVNIQNTDISDEDYEKIRISLESKYNYFSVKYGKITDPNNKLVYNTLRYVRDDNLDFLKSIETPKFEKSDILLKRTIRPTIKITHCDTVEDGFQATLAEYGYIDLNHISKITGYKVDECINRLNGILMYRDPDELFSADIKPADGWLTADEYLSGNVVEKLRKAKLLSSRFPELKVNVEALEKVQPEKIKAVDILAQIGSSWIPEKYIEQFVEEVFGIGTVVEHNTATANWKLSNKVNGNYHSSTSTEYGTADINAMYILENSLNLRDSTVWRDKRDELGNLVYDDKGNKVREKDVEKTIAANHKAEKIKETFKEWVWTDAYRTQDLENIYNTKYNTERARTYDGSHLFFAGMTSSIQLANHQKNAVARVLYGGNTLLAHVVGAGKTFEMTAAAMEMRRIGAANKPLFIVPNHLIGQWGKEFLTLYPDANILLATSEDFEKSRRKAFVNRIATGDYDAVIMGYSTFAKISISPEKRKEYYEQQIYELIEIIQSSDDDDNLSVKDAQKKKKQLETRLKNLEYDTEQDDNIYFENLGVDALFVDEAHNFKNLSINTKLSRIAGIQTTESKRSEDLLLKIQYIKEKQNGLDRGIVFATGTPISNSLTEMYVMKKYLEPDYLREKGLQHFDSWVADFAEVTTNIELSPTGNSWRAKKRCSTFKNLPELMNIYRRVADIQTAETLKLPVPKLKNGKYTICLTKPSEEQKQFIFDCGERAEEVHQKRVDPSKDNMLKITNDGKMCALDMRLVDPTVEDNPDSKVNMAVNNIFNKWEETREDSLTQVVFLDRSTPSKGFNLYDDIKSKLIALGIPEEEIKFIHDAKNDKEKVKLFEDVNEGRVRILVGSTEKMGAGTNIQKKLCALHHIDVPWRPSDIEQREGRILRQGNDCKEVEIFRYATEGTFDSYSWQTIEYKQKFISQVMTNKPLGRSIDDVDEAALNYAEIKSLATGDPRIKRQLELSTQVDNLRREKAEFEADRMKAREEITFTIPTQIKRAEKFIEIFSNAVEYSKQYPRSENFCVEIVDNKITDREEAGKAVKALRKVGGEEPIDVCDYRGFKIQIQYSSLGGYGSFKTIVSHENATLFTSLGVSNTDVFDNIDNAIDVDMPQLLSIHKEELEIAQKNMQKSKEIAEREFPKLKEYQEKREELNKLTSEIGLNDNSGDMDIVFKQDAVTSVIDKSYIRDDSGTIIAKFTYSVPESYIEKIYNDDDNLSLEYGNLSEYVKSIHGDNRFYEKSKKARKIVDDDIPAVDDTMFLTLKQCRAIVLEENSELLTLQGVKSNGEHIKVGTFDYDYQTYQTLSSVGKLYSEKLGIPFGDEDIATSRNRGI